MTPPRRASDLLPERRAMLVQFTAGWRVPSPQDLVHHAEVFGPEQVVETAVELGYPLETCVSLQESCDRIDAVRARRVRFGRERRLRGTARDRVRELLGLKDDDGA